MPRFGEIGQGLSCAVVIGDILQPTHLLFVLVIALLVLGPKRLPEVGRSLGRGLRDFRNALSGEDDSRAEELAAPSPAAPPPATAEAEADVPAHDEAPAHAPAEHVK